MSYLAMGLAMGMLAAVQGDPVEQALSGVNSGDPESCRRAVARLVGLGGDHRKAVEAGAERLPAYYARMLRDELATRDRLGVHYGTPSCVTLQGEAELGHHLKNLEKQAGFVFKADPQTKGAASTLSLNLEKVTGLEALLKIVSESGLGIWTQPGKEGMWLAAGSPKSDHVYCDGSFAFLLRGTSLTRTVDFTGDHPSVYHLNFQALSDPGTRIVCWNSQPEIVEAVTSGGGSLVPYLRKGSGTLQQEAAPANGFDWASTGAMTLQLVLPEKGDEKLSRLRFRAIARVGIGRKTLTVPAGEEGERKAENGDWRVEISTIDIRNNWNFRFDVSLQPKRPQAPEASDAQIQFDIGVGGMPEMDYWVSRRPSGAGFEYEIQCYRNQMPGIAVAPDEKPLKLERFAIHYPESLLDRPVYGEFTDLPLK